MVRDNLRPEEGENVFICPILVSLQSGITLNIRTLTGLLAGAYA